MRSMVLLAAFSSLTLGASAAGQTYTEDKCAPCVVGGKQGSRCCEGGKLSACIPDLVEGPDLCAGKVCTGGTVCQDDQGVCEPGLVDCAGTCRNLSDDEGNCGACGNRCPAGTRCQPSIPGVLGAPGGRTPTP